MEDAPNQAMKGVKEFEATYEMVTDFRKDYDKLMDAVHYLMLKFFKNSRTISKKFVRNKRKSAKPKDSKQKMTN